MISRVLIIGIFAFLLIPFGNNGASAAYAPISDTSGTLEQYKIDSLNRAVITDSVIAICKQSLGLPYKYGGNSPVTGFDCSHFVAYGFGKLGVSLSYSSSGMSQQGTEVELQDVQKGDLLFFKGRNINSGSVGHVALVIDVQPGSIKMIHSTHRGVVIDEFYTSSYYKPRFLKARRISY